MRVVFFLTIFVFSIISAAVCRHHRESRVKRQLDIPYTFTYGGWNNGIFGRPFYGLGAYGMSGIGRYGMAGYGMGMPYYGYGFGKK
ncbi:unnamed protein product [Caenorhabditis bovis]|uniref:Uncharacterized protein n=1 Tax=Caenorhabditis bovis TaxID=2654633 RepID=A0A8S1E9Q2_9PELO|nr:unnamed protein product [Caenorhabditis bovis]